MMVVFIKMRKKRRGMVLLSEQSQQKSCPHIIGLSFIKKIMEGCHLVTVCTNVCYLNMATVPS